MINNMVYIMVAIENHRAAAAAAAAAAVRGKFVSVHFMCASVSSLGRSTSACVSLCAPLSVLLAFRLVATDGA